MCDSDSVRVDRTEEADAGPEAEADNSGPMDLQVSGRKPSPLGEGDDDDLREDEDDEEEVDDEERLGQRRLGGGGGDCGAGVESAGGVNGELLDDEDKSTSSPCSVPDSAAGCRDLQALEIERACMESQGEVSVKWDITRKNKTSIVINGYKMTESRAGKDGRVFWRCSKRFCSATAISLGSRLLSVRQVDESRFHNHPPTGKEEFFRGDFSAPGTPTGVTVKWPVLRASARGPAPAPQPQQQPQTPKAAAEKTVTADCNGEAATSAAMLHTVQAQTASSLLAASLSASATAAPQIQLQHSQYHNLQQQQQQLQHQHAKRMRHSSMESGGSSTSDAALSDPLCAMQQRLNPPVPAAAGGSVSAAAADAHKAFMSLASSLGVIPYSGLFSNSLMSSDSIILQQQQHHTQQQQQQQQQQLHQQQLLQQQLQQQQNNYLGSNLASKTYHSIFNPPPQPLPPPPPPPSSQPPPHEASASPLKEALSQVDNYQLQRQLRRLDGYFRSGIVALADTIVRQGGSGLVVKDAEFVAWERESMTRLFAYMDGLERVHKLSGELL